MNAPGIVGNLPIIRAHYADILRQLVRELGGDGEAVLAEAGVPPSLLAHPENLMTVDQFAALCRAALARCQTASLGLEFGRRLKFTTHGALSQAAISCDTLEEALTVLIKYFRIRFAYMNLSFSVDGEEAVIQLDLGHGYEDLYRFNVDVVMASLMDVNRLLFGDRLMAGGRCLLAFPEPSDSGPYRKLFGDRVTFDTGVNQLRFRRECLSLPMSLSNPVARRVAEAQCEEEMRSIEAATLVSARVSRILESSREGRLPGLDAVAERLSVSPRTLRRQLAAEGVRFQELQERLRHRRALELLRRRELSIDDVADALGYSDPSNFGRAFRKWEGVAPGTWRRQAGIG